SPTRSRWRYPRAEARLPAGVDRRAEAAVVELANGCGERLAEVGHRTRGRVRLGLRDVARPGDDARDARQLRHPRERRRGGGETRIRGERGELPRGLDALVVVDARERLALIERLAVPVEAAVIVGCEGR